MQKPKFMKKEPAAPRATLFGLLIIISLYLALALIGSLVCFGLDNPTAKMPLFSLFAFVLSGGLGALLNSRLFKTTAKAPLFSSLFASLIYLLISAAASGGIFGFSLMNLFCFLLFSGAGLLLGKKRGGKRLSKRRFG